MRRFRCPEKVERKLEALITEIKAINIEELSIDQCLEKTHVILQLALTAIGIRVDSRILLMDGDSMKTLK